MLHKRHMTIRRLPYSWRDFLFIYLFLAVYYFCPLHFSDLSQWGLILVLSYFQVGEKPGNVEGLLLKTLYFQDGALEKEYCLSNFEGYNTVLSTGMARLYIRSREPI